jgi:hypothetical protein
LDSVKTSVEVLELLRSLPQHESVDLLNKLRETAQPATVLSSYMEDHSHAETPELFSSQFSSPLALAPTSTGIELELMTRYATAYPPLSPIDVTSLRLAESILGSPAAMHDTPFDHRDGR